MHGSLTTEGGLKMVSIVLFRNFEELKQQVAFMNMIGTNTVHVVKYKYFGVARYDQAIQSSSSSAAPVPSSSPNAMVIERAPLGNLVEFLQKSELASAQLPELQLLVILKQVVEGMCALDEKAYYTAPQLESTQYHRPPNVQ